MNDIAFFPVHTKADLDQLDADEITTGYLEGLDGEPEPGHNRGRAFWHGWRNGMTDRGRIPKDRAMADLAREVVGRRA